MPLYLQILLLIIGFAVFFLFLVLATGWGVRRVCFKIIAELEEAGALSAGRAMKLQDARQNIFRVGTGNLRPKALNILLTDGLIIKTPNGKYYLNKDKLAQMKTKTGK